MVKRYELGCPEYDYWDMMEDSAGEWVKFDDYDALERDYNILRRDYQAMMDKLKDIWVEG